MEGIANRGRAVMQLMLIVTLLCAWACFERRPTVLPDAVRLVDGTLRAYSLQTAAAQQNVEHDVLNELPTESQSVFRQYRHQFRYSLQFYDDADQEEKEQFLAKVTVDTFFQLAKILKTAPPTRSNVSAAFSATLPSMISDDLRSNLANIQTLHQHSGLGTTATLGQVSLELAPRIQIPGSMQSIEVERCMMFLGGCILAMQLYLSSLIQTFLSLAGDRIPVETRSWIPLHTGRLGQVLTTAWLTVPLVVWAFRQVFLPLSEGVVPAIAQLVLFAALSFTTWAVNDQSSRLRTCDKRLSDQELDRYKFRQAA